MSTDTISAVHAAYEAGMTDYQKYFLIALSVAFALLFVASGHALAFIGAIVYALTAAQFGGVLPPRSLWIAAGKLVFVVSCMVEIVRIVTGWVA